MRDLVHCLPQEMAKWAPCCAYSQPLMALTARSLHCRDSVRLQSYFHRPDEPVSTPLVTQPRHAATSINATHYPSAEWSRLLL